MLNELIELEDKFQSYLMGGDYTFIGPVDQALLPPFIKMANQLAPITGWFRTIHHALGHKPSVRQAANALPTDAQLRIYVVTPTRHDGMLLHDTIEGYCNKNNIV